MSFIEISSDLRQAVDSEGTPLKLIDSQTGGVYVLVDESTFEQIQAALRDNLAEKYPAQLESAMRAGWDDPVMDEYNDFDLHRKQ